MMKIWFNYSRKGNLYGRCIMSIEPEKSAQEPQKMPVRGGSLADMKNRIKASAQKIAKKNINEEIKGYRAKADSLKKQKNNLLAENNHRFPYEFYNDALVSDAAKIEMKNLENKLKDTEATLGLCVKDKKRLGGVLKKAQEHLQAFKVNPGEQSV